MKCTTFTNFEELRNILKSGDYLLYQKFNDKWKNKGLVYYRDKVSEYMIVHKNNKSLRTYIKKLNDIDNHTKG